MAQGQEGAYNDAAFLYLLFTGQFFLILYLVIAYARKALKQREKTSKKYFIVRGLVIVFLGFWFIKVFQLVQEEAQSTSQGLFDPHEILGISTNVKFNSPEIKKAYRHLAVKYHPDKIQDGTDAEAASERFQRIVRAYETLSVSAKYDNWQKYGDPDGSKAFKAMEIALPSFLLKPENQSTVLFCFFLGFIFLPIYYVYQRMRHSERFFKNGLLTENRGLLIKALINAIVSNKMNPKLTDDQIIEVYEQAKEVQVLNEEIGKKTTVRDMLKNQLKEKESKEEGHEKAIYLIIKLNEILLDEQTCLTLQRGKIQIGNDQSVSLNLVDTLASFMDYASRLQKSSQQQPQTLYLKAFVDGLKPKEDIFQGYLMTYQIELSSPLEEPSIGFLVNDITKQVKRVVEVQGHKELSMQKLLRQSGAKRYSFVIMSANGRVIKSNQAFYNVKQQQRGMGQE